MLKQDNPIYIITALVRQKLKTFLRNAGEDRPGMEGSRIAIGQTRAGRYLRVIYVLDHKRDEIFVITGYELTGKPLLAYRRRRRKGKR